MHDNHNAFMHDNYNAFMHDNHNSYIENGTINSTSREHLVNEKLIVCTNFLVLVQVLVISMHWYSYKLLVILSRFNPLLHIGYYSVHMTKILILK